MFSKISIYIILSLFSISGLTATELCVIGDTGMGNKAQFKVAEALKKANCTDILITGDVIYPNGARSASDRQWKSKFEKPYKDLIDSGVKFYVTLGNHDHRAGSVRRVNETHVEYSQKHAYYVFPNRYHNFKIGDICIWSIDTEVFDSTQEKDIEKSMSETNNCERKVAFAHHPIKSSGKHGDAGRLLQRRLRPLLEKHIDIYFAGHDHHLSDEGTVVGSLGQFRQIISGAGAKLRRVDSCRRTGCIFAESEYGFVKAQFNTGNVILSFRDSNNNELHKTVLKEGIDLLDAASLVAKK